MIKVTRELLRRANSCYGAARENELIPADGLTIREVAALDIPVEDKVWAICKASNAPDNTLREFACWCARNALNAERKAGREPDPKCWTTVDVAERYARGEASKAELKAAWDAAYEDACVARDASNAAYDAAYDAAYYTASRDASNAACYAACYAACDAAYDAAYYTASRAASNAACYAACEAYEAACDAAYDAACEAYEAACDAACDAAYGIAREEQLAELVRLLDS